MPTRKTKIEKEAAVVKEPVPAPEPLPGLEATAKTFLQLAVESSPHKDGWNKAAAQALAAEFASLTETLTVPQMMVIANLYKNYAGWGNLMDALAAKYCGKKLKGT